MSKPKNIQNRDLYDEEEARKRHTPPEKPVKDGYQNAKQETTQETGRH